MLAARCELLPGCDRPRSLAVVGLQKPSAYCASGRHACFWGDTHMSAAPVLAPKSSGIALD